MTTRSRYRAGVLEFYDDQTHERVRPLAPLVFEEDFIGYQAMLSESGSAGRWLAATVETGGSPVSDLKADGENGQFRIALDNTSEAQDAYLYMGDQRNFNVKSHLVIEIRAIVTIVPTTGVACVLGLAGNHNADKDTITEGAWFRMQASGAILAESDDTTNNNDDVATGITATATDAFTLRIDFTDLSDVKFYINGARVASGTTFDMSNLTDAEGLMQPYFSLDKATGTGVGTIDIDYVRIWSKRTEQ